VFKKLHIKRIIILLFFIVLGLNLSIQTVFAFYGNDLKTVNGIILEQQTQKLEQQTQKEEIDFVENKKAIEDETIKKLITAIDIKNDSVDEKEKAYDKAINQSKWLISLFGVLCLVILAGLGFYHDKKINLKTTQLEKLFERENKLREKENTIEIRKAAIDIQDRNLVLQAGNKKVIDDATEVMRQAFRVQMAEVTDKLKEITKKHETLPSKAENSVTEEEIIFSDND